MIRGKAASLLALAALVGVTAAAADTTSSTAQCVAAQDAANPNTNPDLTGSCQVGSVRNP